MKFYPAENMGFFDTVQAFFLELTGRGATLSGRDVDLLLRWRDEGASAAVVCQGLDRAVQELAERPRDIWSCRHYVEPLVERARRSAAGSSQTRAEADHVHSASSHVSAPQPESSNYEDAALRAARDAIESAGRACESEAMKEIYRDAWRALNELETAEFKVLIEIESDLARALFDALDESERRRIDDAIAEVHSDLLRRMAPTARAGHLREQRKRILRRDHGLPSLLD